MSRELMKEFRTLRELRHDNINSFIGSDASPRPRSTLLTNSLFLPGACVEPMRILLVSDYCAKGSLYDIIENEDIKLDNLFIASLINDLIKVRDAETYCLKGQRTNFVFFVRRE
jgi:guanylate cyclase, other